MAESTTYIIAGFDDNGAFKETFALSQRPDIVVIRPQQGETLQETLARSIDPNASDKANIVIASHGNERGQITWKEGENPVPYDDVFQALPVNGSVRAISVASCYGGTALEVAHLQHVPPGAMLQSLTGSKVPGSSTFISAFLQEAVETAEPACLLLKALDNCNPELLVKDIKKWNKEGYDFNITSPNKVLPHTVGIGGKPPVEINLNKEGKAIRGKLDEEAYLQAKDMTKQYLHTEYKEEKKGVLARWFSKQQPDIPLPRQIDDVAAKMQQKNWKPGNCQEQRIMYALTISYLETSGELKSRIQEAGGPAIEARHQGVARDPQTQEAARHLASLGPLTPAQDVRSSPIAAGIPAAIGAHR